VRLPVAVFFLACRKSMPMPRSGCVLPSAPASALHMRSHSGVSAPLLMRGYTRHCQAENPLIVLSRFPEPALLAASGTTASPGQIQIKSAGRIRLSGVGETTRGASALCLIQPLASWCAVSWFILPPLAEGELNSLNGS
jgi:hypothetical protein